MAIKGRVDESEPGLATTRREESGYVNSRQDTFWGELAVGDLDVLGDSIVAIASKLYPLGPRLSFGACG